MLLEGPFFVTFLASRQLKRVPTPDHEHWTMDMLTDGFWVTEGYVLCKESQGHFWIPPSQLILIEKRE